VPGKNANIVKRMKKRESHSVKTRERKRGGIHAPKIAMNKQFKTKNCVKENGKKKGREGAAPDRFANKSKKERVKCVREK